MAAIEIMPDFVVQVPEHMVPDFDVPKGFEFIGRRLVEIKQRPALYCHFVGEIGYLLHRYLDVHPIGAMFLYGPYRCFPDDRSMIRKPCVSVLLCDPATFVPPLLSMPTAPALVAEYVAPDETYTEVMTKIKHYRSAGVELIWVIDAHHREAHIHRADGPSETLTEEMSLTGEDVLPGFTLPLAAILPKKV